MSYYFRYYFVFSFVKLSVFVSPDIRDFPFVAVFFSCHKVSKSQRDTSEIPIYRKSYFLIKQNLLININLK